MSITMKVYKDSEEYETYNIARFPRMANGMTQTPATFEFKGHRWRYHVTSFDDNGEYDLLWRPGGKEPELMLSDITFRDHLASAAMSSIPLTLDYREQEIIAKAAYQMADAMLKARD